MRRLVRPVALLLGIGLFLLAAQTALAAPPDVELHHQMAWNETLADVAVRFGVPLNSLADANSISDLYLMHPGRWLALPPSAEAAPTPTTTYTVQPGDTLSQIAIRFGTTVDALASANGIADPSNISVGQILTITIAPMGPMPVEVGPLHDVEWTPAPVAQGQVLVVKVRVEPGVPIEGEIEGAPLVFIRDGDAVFSMLPVGMFEETGARNVVLWVGDSTLDRIRVAFQVQIVAGDFVNEAIEIPADRTYLLDPAIMAEDRSRLNKAFTVSTVARLWESTFQEPISGTVTTAYGTRRVYNSGVLESAHAGIDISANIGVPIHAANAGRVVFAGTLQVYGNGVIIDHGLGLCTAYFHMSSIAVELGQQVQAGQVVGEVGNTGLSTGSHLHWEMRLNNVPVDPMQWVYQSIP